MRHSESLASIAPALVAAQDDIRAVEKSATNPHFKSKYAPLDAIIAMVRPALAKHGLAIVQGAEATDDGKALSVETRLIHTSGEWLANAVYIPLSKMDPQGSGAGVTYGRRFGLSALLSIATDDDDDGNAASRPSAAKQAPRAKEAPSEEGPPSGAPLPRWLGAPEDRPMPFGNTKGKSLGDHSKDHLRKIEKWCVDKKDLRFESLIHDIRLVLADKALAPKPLTDTERVERIKAEEEEMTSLLPFKP